MSSPTTAVVRRIASANCPDFRREKRSATSLSDLDLRRPKSTSVGAAFHSAAALGVGAVLVTPRCSDPLYRRSVRGSMGTVF